MIVKQSLLNMDDDWILAEIERQLSALSSNDLDSDDDEDDYNPSDSNNNLDDDGDNLPDSLLQYTKLTEDQLQHFVSNLNECDDVLQESDRGIFSVSSVSLNEHVFLRFIIYLFND